MKKRFGGFMAATSAMVASVCTSVFSLPVLQIDILNGTYDQATQTVIAPDDQFTLYALLDLSNNKASIDDDFFLSIAVAPQVSMPGMNLGSFVVDGQTINGTGDMVWGTPPIESASLTQPFDGGDLSPHGIFPTYFTELKFKFDPLSVCAPYNTQDNTGVGPGAGSGLVYRAFNFDISNWATSHSLHFDLYNLSFRKGDIDVGIFAPFSHDGESGPRRVPEPMTVSLLGLGLLGLTFFTRKRG